MATKRNSKKTSYRFRLEERVNGDWYLLNTYDTKERADKEGKERARRGRLDLYRVVKEKF